MECLNFIHFVLYWGPTFEEIIFVTAEGTSDDMHTEKISKVT